MAQTDGLYSLYVDDSVGNIAHLFFFTLSFIRKERKTRKKEKKQINIKRKKGQIEKRK